MKQSLFFAAAETLVPYKTYPRSSESLADRRRRRKLLRRQRWRGRWLALLALSSLITLSWTRWARSDLPKLRISQEPPSTLKTPQEPPSTQKLPPQPLPGTGTAATPRSTTSSELHYEDWVQLLRTEANEAASQGLSDLNLLAGDSISLWFPVDLLPYQQSWLNQGISGETAQGLQKRLEDWQILEPQRIFLMIGINDLLKGESAEVVVETNQRIVEQLQLTHPTAEIILQSILPHSGDRATWEGREKLRNAPIETIQAVNQELAAIAQSSTQDSVQYLDLYPLFSDQKGLLRSDLTTDGLHLNSQGYLVWSTALKMFEQQEQDQFQLMSSLESESFTESLEASAY